MKYTLLVSEVLLLNQLGANWKSDLVGQDWFVNDLLHFYLKQSVQNEFPIHQQIEGYLYTLADDGIQVEDPMMTTGHFIQFRIEQKQK